jgi:hypothetical protein
MAQSDTNNPVGVPVIDPDSISSRGVVTRVTRLRAMVYAAAGAEPPYDVYRFARNRKRFERPGHNPFDS